MDETQGIQVLRQKYPNEITVGFTGTRDSMVIEQWRQVQRIMVALFVDRTGEFHDGDCIGADDQAYNVVPKHIRKVGHPCNLPKYRVFNEHDHTHPISPPLVRNRVIVRSSNVMIAAPKEYEEQFKGSGTWATIRYARRAKKPLFIVWPDATVSVEIEM